MYFRTFFAAGAAAATLFAAGAAQAALVFVDRWDVTAGPAGYGPLSGQGAAALLFGGDPEDYVISTLGSSVSGINFQSWYLGEAIPGAAFIAAQGATEFLGGDITAYGQDPAVTSARFFNYAFRDDGNVGGVPEPATWALMIGGFGLAGSALRRRVPSALR